MTEIVQGDNDLGMLNSLIASRKYQVPVEGMLQPVSNRFALGRVDPGDAGCWLSGGMLALPVFSLADAVLAYKVLRIENKRHELVNMSLLFQAGLPLLEIASDSLGSVWRRHASAPDRVHTMATC